MSSNDLPYTEILTADYIMANPLAAEAYGAATEFEDSDDVRTMTQEFKPSEIVSYYRDWTVRRSSNLRQRIGMQA